MTLGSGAASAAARKRARSPAARGTQPSEGVALGGQARGDECRLDRARARQHDDLAAGGERARHEQAARIGDQRHARVRDERDLLARQRAGDEALGDLRLAPLVAGHELGRRDLVRAQERRACGACPRTRSRSPPRSASSARSVMSRRFPSGVGTTVSTA